MNLFKRKKIVHCKLCEAKFPEKDVWKLHMNTAEGTHIIRVCPDCAKVLDNAKENITLWMTQ